MNRYEDCNESLVETFIQVMEERFPHLVNLNFKLVFDTKKRVKQGKICLASVELASPKIRYFSIDEKALEGYDYVMFVDAKAWELASDKDKKRLISHELRHVFIDEKGALKIIDHDINDFVAEVKLNEDDPEWGRNLAMLTEAVYSQEKDDKKGMNFGG